MGSNSKLRNHKKGYTLIELTFSIAFLTILVTVSLVSFIGIFGIYSKAQSLTRTQEEARQAMDAITRDLRQTVSVSQITGPVTGATILNGYCLNAGVRQIGYAQVLVAELGYYVLAKSESCTDFTSPRYVMSTDVWSDRDPLWSGAQSSFLIEQVNVTADGPVIWQTRVGAFRGASAPSKPGSATETDVFSAGTMLQSIVVTRQD